jgi:hypothetical protein
MKEIIVKGMKFNKGKLRWTILPFEAVKEVLKILEYGAIKYDVDNWRNFEDTPEELIDALFRHMVDYLLGERDDRESGMNHLTHAATNALMLVALAIQRGEIDPEGTFKLDHLEEWIRKKKELLEKNEN